MQLQNLSLINDVGLILVSPMRRTLQTALGSVGWMIEKGIPVVVSPDWTETSSSPCDTGSIVDVLTAEFPQFAFDTLYPGWPQKEGKYAFTQTAIAARGLGCRLWLKDRPEKVIVVFSHADFLYGGICSAVFQNAEYRVFDFARDGDNLIERVNARQGEPPRRASLS